VAQGYRPSTYRSISGIPKTHLITCDYRGFGLSSLNNPPHIPTETGLITDAISLVSYVTHDLGHPISRTVLLGQSLGTAVTAATALYYTDPTSPQLPSDLVSPKHSKPAKEAFAGIILVAPFRNLPLLLQHYRISGIFPVLKPLQAYPRIANFLSSRIVDTWPTLPRLQSLVAAEKSKKHGFHISLLHARNDQDISYHEAETLFEPLQTLMLGSSADDAAGDAGVSAEETRRSIHGGERVKRGAFAYKKVEDGKGERCVELEVTRYGGHNEIVGWAQVALAVRRAFERRGRMKPGLDVE
jgi:pimeloyl-ACP methyl ester carboxylesterase